MPSFSIVSTHLNCTFEKHYKASFSVCSPSKKFLWVILRREFISHCFLCLHTWRSWIHCEWWNNSLRRKNCVIGYGATVLQNTSPTLAKQHAEKKLKQICRNLDDFSLSKSKETYVFLLQSHSNT